MDYAGLLPLIAAHQQSYFLAQNDQVFVYHDLRHTLNVVKAAEEIAHHYHLTERDHFIVVASAWFHDAGYFDDAKNHETEGAALAAAYLQTLQVPEADILAIKNCILATRMPQQPKNFLEQIVCDADLYHLGTEDFVQNNKKMRREMEARMGKAISKDEWRTSTIRLLETHHYFTDYCRNLLGDTKQAHLDKMRQKETKQLSKTTITSESPLPPQEAPDSTSGKRPSRGIETMFRITSNNNQRLNDMADNKAQIMITVNSIILSAVLSILLRKLEEYSYLAWPTYLILGVSVFTIIFSILATRPNLQPGIFSQKDIDEKKVNLLFFGNFHKMKLEDYSAGMLAVMNDRDFLYGTLIRDVYAQGVVLGRKYRLLRISYNIFMYGLIVSVLAFVTASILAGK